MRLDVAKGYIRAKLFVVGKEKILEDAIQIVLLHSSYVAEDF